MRLRVLLAAAILLAVAATPPAAAQPIPTELAATLELHERSPTFTFSTPCGGARFEATGDGFRFEEDAAGAGGDGLGCGEARWRLDVPSGARRIVVSFAAQVEAQGAGGQSVLLHAVELRDINGAVLLRVPFVPHEDGILLPALEVPARVRQLVVAWTFDDPGLQASRGVPAVDPGRAHTAVVQDIDLRYTGVPVETDAQATTAREGLALEESFALRIPVTAAQMERHDVAIRVGVPPGLTLVAARGPDGGIPVADVPAGELEVLAVSAEETSAHGAGTYTLTFRSSDREPISAWLAVVAAILVLAPTPLAVLAWTGARRFEQQAFGHFKRSAQRLRVAILLTLVYYAVVLVAALAGGRLWRLAVLPLSGGAMLLYVQIVVAVGAFGVLWLVARELAAITRPAGGG